MRNMKLLPVLFACNDELMRTNWCYKFEKYEGNGGKGGY